MSSSRLPFARRTARGIAAATALSLAGLGLTALPALADDPAAVEPLTISDGDVFISEIHYDNIGDDTGEAIEVQAPVGTDLSAWQLVRYNGNNGSAAVVYSTPAALDALGVVGDSGVDVVSYPKDGLQNGDRDGVALVDPNGTVVELISYEGVFTAGAGPAAGMTSTDIGVSQSNSTPIGQSLQRIDGEWTGPATSSFGALNTAGDPDPDPEPGEEVAIAEIQGTGAASPLVGQTVTTTGVVTAVYPTGGFNGYYLQTAGSGGDTDASRTASDGLFVYSAATVGEVAIGDHVQVTGPVSEYFGLTQVTVAAGGVTPLDGEFEPVQPVADFVLGGTDAEREVFEGMLVLPADRYVVADTYALGGWGDTRFGSMGLGLDGPLLQETDVALPGTPEFDAVAADNAARSVTLDDGQSARTPFDAEVPYLTGNPDARTGVGLQFSEPVVVDYRFQWNFQPTAPVTGDASDRVTFSGGNTQAANTSPEDVGGDLTISSFNVLNYFTTLGEDLAGCEAYTDRQGNPLTVSGGCDARGAWDETNLQRQQDKIVAAINGLGADVVGLEEIENSAAFGQDRDTALAALVDALNADGGTWAFAPSPAAVPADEDVIRTAFIYDSEVVTLDGDSTILLEDPAFSNAREPLAQAFSPVSNPDYSFLAVVNHFKSKGGDCGDLPEGCFDADRVAQAQALTAFADETADAAQLEDIFLVGDFNSYSAENPAVAIEDAGYTNLNSEYAQETTYVFGGKVGSLDHVYANESALARVTGADVWRINAEESVLAEYSRWNYFASEHVALGSPFRASDHNPVLVGLDVPDGGTPGTSTIDILSINDFHGRIEASGQSAGAAVLACVVDDYRDANPNTLFVSAGDNIGASTFTSAVAQDQPTLDVLNLMGLDVSALGNHEFDKGAADVDDRVIPASDFPWLGANIYGPDGERAYQPYELIETGGVTVGFVGAITEDMPTLVSPAGVEGLEWRDMTTEVNAVATDLTDGDASNGEADVIVVLVHDGSATPDVTAATGTQFGDLVENIDPSVTAIISGHTHQVYAQDVDGVWVTQAAQYGEMLGHLQLEVDPATGEVLAAEAVNVDLTPAEGPACEGDPEVAAVVAAAVAEAEVLGAVPLGEITDDFLRAVQADGTENRGGESTIGNFVADVQLWATQDNGTQIAFMNPGGIRDNLLFEESAGEGDGVVTYREAAIVQPFANTLVTMDLTGEQIAEALEQQWQPAGSPRPFLKLGVSQGLQYVYDADAPAGERIVSMTLDGEPVGADESYRVVVNSFLASGGDAFSAFTDGENRADSGRVDLDAMVDFFAAQDGPVSPDPVQRAVGVSWVSDPGATLAAGDEIAFEMSSLAFSRDEPKPSEVDVTLDGVELGSFAVDPTIVSTTDEVGRASVSAVVPDGVAGEVVLEVSDDVNGVTYSTTLTVEDAVVDTTRPEVTLVAPTSAGPFRTLSIQVDATDDVGLNRVVANIYSGGTLVRSTQTAMDGATSGTHTATVTLPDGRYTIRYNASDVAGNVARTATFEVVIDTTRPTVTLVSPTTAGPLPTLDIQVDAADANGLRLIVANVYEDGVLVERTQSTADGATSASHTATVSLPDGDYTIRYNAHDLAGNLSATGTFDVTIDSAPEPPDTWEPWKEFAKWLWKLLKVLFPWWPWP